MVQKLVDFLSGMVDEYEGQYGVTLDRKEFEGEIVVPPQLRKNSFLNSRHGGIFGSLTRSKTLLTMSASSGNLTMVHGSVPDLTRSISSTPHPKVPLAGSVGSILLEESSDHQHRANQMLDEDEEDEMLRNSQKITKSRSKKLQSAKSTNYIFTDEGVQLRRNSEDYLVQERTTGDYQQSQLLKNFNSRTSSMNSRALSMSPPPPPSRASSSSSYSQQQHYYYRQHPAYHQTSLNNSQNIILAVNSQNEGKSNGNGKVKRWDEGRSSLGKRPSTLIEAMTNRSSSTLPKQHGTLSTTTFSRTSSTASLASTASGTGSAVATNSNTVRSQQQRQLQQIKAFNSYANNTGSLDRKQTSKSHHNNRSSHVVNNGGGAQNGVVDLKNGEKAKSSSKFQLPRVSASKAPVVISGDTAEPRRTSGENNEENGIVIDMKTSNKRMMGETPKIVLRTFKEASGDAAGSPAAEEMDASCAAANGTYSVEDSAA